MTIALAMLVRDEQENVVACLDAAGPLVDGLVITDTGSVDDTEALIRSWAAENGKPLDLTHEPWVNFRDNRTSLIRRASGLADWLLMLDADMIVRAPSPLPDLESADEWTARVESGKLHYALPLFIRASKPWRYAGVAHSYLECPGGADVKPMPGLSIEDHSHTTVEKLERDLVVLLADVAANPDNARSVFYLAQTYYDLDRFSEAIHFYRRRTEMGGWDEELYFARYRLGCLLTERVSFETGARVLLEAWEGRPSRIEALRALAGAATNVANKMPLPPDRLFVGTDSWVPREIVARPEIARVEESPPPPFPKIAPRSRLRGRRAPRGPEEITAIIPTRGNVPLGMVIDSLPYEDILVWDNSATVEVEQIDERVRWLGGTDYKPFARYAAIPFARHPWIYWQDDDILFYEHDALIAAYEPGRIVTNMDDSWIDGAGYRDLCSMQGAGSLCDARLPAKIWKQYLARYEWDADALIEADFVFGTLVPFKIVDLGYRARDFADNPDRLYMQPGQTERKHAMIARCREILLDTRGQEGG